MSAFTTQKKGKKYSHVVSFKLDDERKKKLDECLWLLKAKGKRQSNTMRDFVDKLHTFLMQSGDRDVETDILKKENRDLNKEVRKLRGLTKHYREETEKLGKFIEANKTEVKTLPNSTQTMPIVKEKSSQSSKDKGLTQKPLRDLITCPKDKKAYPLSVCKSCPEESSCETYQNWKKVWG